jgi:hypothetical protein
VEGYWYWLITAHRLDRDVLRSLWGYEAKAKGRELLSSVRCCELPEFRRKLVAALWAKVEQTAHLRVTIAESNLPFAHYYVMDGVERPAGGQWLIPAWEQIRRELKRQTNE